MLFIIFNGYYFYIRLFEWHLFSYIWDMPHPFMTNTEPGVQKGQLCCQILCLFDSIFDDSCFLRRWASLILQKAMRSAAMSQLLSKTSHDSPSFHPFEAPLNAAVEPRPEGLHPHMIKKVNYWFVYHALKTQSALLNREHIKGEYC